MSEGTEVVDHLMELVSNWGRWGADDDRGTMNLLTEARTRRAIALSKTGQTIACGRPVGPKASDHGDLPVLHHMLSVGGDSPTHGAHIMADWFGLAPHGSAITHLDALNHVSWHGRLYNGKAASVVTASRGGAFGSAERVSAGIVTRGVLLDIPEATGVDWVDPARPITPTQFEACERAAGLEVQEGDAVLVRTGRDRRLSDSAVPAEHRTHLAGLDAACVPWLRQRDVALLGSEGMHEVVPAIYPDLIAPVHVLALVGAGMWLIDNLALDSLAGTCKANTSWAFMFVLSPIALKNATGVPVNPLAVF